MAAPTNTLPGTSGADILATVTPSVVEGKGGNDTITLNNGTDWANAQAGDDSISFAATSGTVDGEIKGQDGNDTIRVLTAMTAPTFSATVKAGKGDDLLLADGVSNYSSAKIYGQSGNDTIIFSDTAGTNIGVGLKGGDDTDSIRINSGAAFVTTTVQGNDGADTITWLATDSGASRVSGGKGKDVLTIGQTAAGDVASLSTVAGGDGKDIITITTAASVSSIIGGGQQDTIVLGATFAGGTIYGDGGTSTTDAKDLIGSTAVLTNALSSVSIYGGGGDDTIRIQTADHNVVITGDGGNDSITVVAGESAISISSGDGADTISFGNTGITGSTALSANVDGGADNDLIYIGNSTTQTEVNGFATVSGGAGDDTIALAGFSASSSATLISGGDGADSIQLALSGLSMNTLSTDGVINGGAGSDTINLVMGTGTITNIGSGLTSGVATVAYGSSDVINLTATGILAGNAAAGIVTVVQTALGLNVTALGAGDVAVYSDGTDTFFAYATTAGTESGIVLKVSGADLVTYTGAAADVAVNSANFGFTLSASAATGVSLTLT